MGKTRVIHGRFSRRGFKPDNPPPDVEGPADLIVYQNDPTTAGSRPIFDLFGKAVHLRSADDLDKQLQEERQSWGSG